MYKKNHLIEFEKHANAYDSFSIIQRSIAKELVNRLDSCPKNVLDVGCGTGEIYKNIPWKLDSFIGVDFSQTMCKLHPESTEVTIFCEDFESESFKEKIFDNAPFDIILSSSSLQWAKDLENTFKFYSSISDKVAFSIFTDGTFKSLYKTLKRKSFLPTYDFLTSISTVLNNAHVSKKIYKLDFEDKLSLFRYIKQSGISGGNEPLNYKKMKYLLNEYPYKYLEFEATFIVSDVIF